MPQVAALMLGMLWVYAMQVVVLAAEIRPLCQHLSERLKLCESLCGIHPRLGTISVHMMGYDEVLLRWGYMSAWTCTDSEHLHGGELLASLMGKPKWSILQNGLKGKKGSNPEPDFRVLCHSSSSHDESRHRTAYRQSTTVISAVAACCLSILTSPSVCLSPDLSSFPPAEIRTRGKRQPYCIW